MAPGASTLKGMAQRGLIRNLPGLQDVGDTPYELVKPALRRITDPQQLRAIEIRSPHIADADEELWVALIKRDVSDWESKMVRPTNPRSWWKVYRKLYREEKETREEQLNQLQNAMQGRAKEKEANKANILDVTVQQRFKQKIMIDGVINRKAGTFGHEGVPSVRQAHKTGKNLISALSKQAADQSKLRRLGTSWDNRPAAETRMWRQEPSAARITPNKPRQQTMTEKSAANALKRALAADEKLKEERAQRVHASPPRSPPVAKATPAGVIQPSASLTEWNRTHPQASSGPPSPPNTASPAPSAASSAAPARRTQPSTVASAAPTSSSTSQGQAQPTSPSNASPAIAEKHVAPLGPGAGIKRSASPAVTNPMPQKRTKAATSIFMPKRAKR